MTKIISWNLLRLVGASLDDVAGLVRRERPGLLLMQEATRSIDGLTSRIGGHYARVPLPGRIHGLAVWSPAPLPEPRVLALPDVRAREASMGFRFIGGAPADLAAFLGREIAKWAEVARSASMVAP